MANLTTTEGLQTWLTSHDIKVSSVQSLTGGFANYVWRLTYPDGMTSVIKHTEPIVRNHEDVNLPASRVNHEASSMHTIGTLLRDLKGSLHISPPTVISQDLKDHMVIMSDGKGKNLKAVYPNLSTAQVQDIGRRLGHWLAKLHARTAVQSTDIGDGGNPVGRKIYRYSYQGLHRVLAEHYKLGDEKSQLGQQVHDKYADLLLTDDEGVCQGDFWTGNIIVNEESVSSTSSLSPSPATTSAIATSPPNSEESSSLPSSAPIDLMVVDWEICRRGNPATDVAQFVAEAYLLDRFSEHGQSRGLGLAFLEGYIDFSSSLSSSTNDNENSEGVKTTSTKTTSWFWERFLIHWCTHVIFWPTYVPWGTPEGMKEVVLFATGVIEKVLNGEADAKRVFEEVFRPELLRVGAGS